MSTKTDINLVDTTTSTTEGGDWFQIHNTHEHGDLSSPHTHYPEVNINTDDGIISTNRRDRQTTSEDINLANDYLVSGVMRNRTNRKDKGGPQ